MSALRSHIRKAVQRLYGYKSRLNQKYGLLTAQRRVLPDFIIGGTMKGGTTLLYDLLTGHPQVIPAIKKEVHFFDHLYDRGLDFYRSHFPLKAKMARSDGQKYLTGESSPSYLLLSDKVAPRICESLPGVKLIFLLREPASRAYSHYQHDRRRGRLDGISFDEIVARETKVPTNYLKRGHYKEQLQGYYEFISQDNIRVYLSEDLNNDTFGIFNDVCHFLGIDPLPELEFKKSHEGNYEDQMSLETRKKLKDYFSPLNKELSTFLQRKHLWQDAF